jgi:hypothetical protein
MLGLQLGWPGVLVLIARGSVGAAMNHLQVQGG